MRDLPFYEEGLFLRVITCKNWYLLMLIDLYYDNLELYKIWKGGSDWEEKVSGGSKKNKEE